MICISKPRICTTEKRCPKFCTPEPKICTTDSVVKKKTGLQILGFTDIQGSSHFIKCSTESQEIYAVKLGYLGATLRQDYEILNGV